MNTHSIMDDPLPYSAPKLQKPPKRVKSDWEKLADSKQYPVIEQYLNDRKTFYQRYLPSGDPVEGMSEAEQIQNWKNAVVIITEIENIQKIILSNRPNG